VPPTLTHVFTHRLLRTDSERRHGLAPRVKSGGKGLGGFPERRGHAQEVEGSPLLAVPLHQTFTCKVLWESAHTIITTTETRLIFARTD
jgi:hypothetical protein